MTTLIRYLLLGALMAVACPVLEAQVRIGPKGPYRIDADEEDTGSERWDIKATPAAVPELALSYSLLPDPALALPGNAAAFYREALLELQRTLATRRSLLSDMAAWQDLRPARLPADRARLVVREFSGVLDLVRAGAQRIDTDWGMREDRAASRWHPSLPELRFSDAIELSRCLALIDLKCRLAMAEGDYAEAEPWLQCGWRLARDIGRRPRLNDQITAVGLGNRMLVTVRHWIGSSDSPNLFWALARLELPIGDSKRALEYELRIPELLIAGSDDVLWARSKEEWNAIYRRLTQAVTGGDRRNEAVLRLTLIQLYPLAKRELRSWGYQPDQLAGLPARGIVFLHQYHVARHNRHALAKWLALPEPACAQGMRRTLRQLREEGWIGTGVTAEGVPRRNWLDRIGHSAEQATRYYFTVRDSQQLLLAKRNALMVVEALRHFAARHDGRLPQRLEEITSLPVPINPLTRQAFGYRRLSDHAAEVLIDGDENAKENLATGAWRILRIDVRP